MITAGIASMVVRVYWAPVTIRARRTAAVVWASRMPVPIRAGRLLVIFGTDLSLGLLQTGVTPVVVRALPVHWA